MGLTLPHAQRPWGLRLSAETGRRTLGHQPCFPWPGQGDGQETGKQQARLPVRSREEAGAHALASAWGPCASNGGSAKIFLCSFLRGSLLTSRSQAVCRGLTCCTVATTPMSAAPFSQCEGASGTQGPYIHHALGQAYKNKGRTMKWLLWSPRP